MSTTARVAARAATRARLCGQRRLLSSSRAAAAKEADPTAAAAATSATAAEQRRILDDLRARNAASTSSSSSGQSLSSQRKTINDRILEGEVLRRAQSRPSGLGAAASLGAGAAEGERPSLLDKLTAEGKPWKELKMGQKVARGTRYSTRFLLVVTGGAFTLAVIYTLGTELFAPNSPSVIMADAIRRVKRKDDTFTVLLEPLRFLTHPPSNDVTDPSQTLPPLPASARSSLRAHRPVVTYSIDSSTGRQLMRLHFWIVGRARGTELGWFEEARGWTEHQLRQMSARVQEAWDRLDVNGSSGVEFNTSPQGFVGSSAGQDEPSGSPASSSSSVVSFISAPFRAVGQLFGAVTRPTGDLGLHVGEATSFGRKLQPGTFTTAEAIAELEKDDAGVFQYRSLYLRVPHDAVLGNRVWIIRRPGEVKR